MRMILQRHLVVILAVLFCTQVFAREHSCGTARLIQQARQYRENSALKQQALAKTAERPCPAESFYDSVYTKKTKHFQIFYTLAGPNKTTEVFIDTLAKSAEDAYLFHTKKMGMLTPRGLGFTKHYEQTVEDNLYPIEVIDVDQMRGTQYYIGGKCHGCFGLTIPDDDDGSKSELIIDNDFLYTPNHNAQKDTVFVDGKACPYDIADQELRNDAHDYSYVDRWEEAIRVTTVHELYHAVQLRYLDLNQYYTFWFEASASGIEELAAPDIDDYFTYLPAMALAVGTPLDNMIQDYGAGIFLLYLHNFIDENIDKMIWEGFHQDPHKDFTYQLEKIAKKKNIDLDSIFHDFAVKLSFAGNRAAYLDSTQWICSDEKSWPDFTYFQQTSQIKPSLQNLSYEFYTQGERLDLTNFTGKASLVSYQNKSAEIIPLKTTNAADSIYRNFKKYNSADSIIWVFSRLGEQKIPTIIRDSTIRAYPSPWRGGNLCFTPLSSKTNFIEIRNRRGDLISRERYEGITLCLEESYVKHLMTPGVYKFRIGSKGKAQDFIIIY